jgi:hypothetical protein
MKNGNIITKTPLMKLLALKNESPDSEFNSLFHLTERHLSVDKAERMNVRLAAQTLSRSVAVALTRYLPHDPEAQELAIFIRNMNDWFDILNSHNTLPTVPLKKPFSNTFDQAETLVRVLDMVKNMIRRDKKSIQVFQKGIIISTISIKSLFYDMKQRYGISYILTYKVNQDVLENLFSRIRCWGGTDHPTPLRTISRLKLIILGSFKINITFTYSLTTNRIWKTKRAIFKTKRKKAQNYVPHRQTT